jgi:hypothetical protein
VILTDLRIQLEDYGPNKGKHTGKATFSGKAGQVTLNLNQHHIEQIFLTCADSIVDTAKAAARHLTMTVIEHQKTIEQKAGPLPPDDGA